MKLPTSRGHLSTEQRHEQSYDLDAMPTRACVDLLVRDHQRVASAVAGAAGAIGAFVDALAVRMAEGGRLVYVGAGTSGRLGVLDASECPPTFQSDPEQVIGIIAGGDAALRRSSEGKEDDPRGAVAALDELAVGPRDTVLGIAAGGTTPYVLGAIVHAASCGAMTGLLTCVAADHSNTPVPPDHLILLDTGPEVLTGSTRLKAGSATKLALNIISTTTFIKLGKVYSNLMVDLRFTNAKLVDRAIRIFIEVCPEVTREQAASLLQRAEGRLKAAIVMHRRDVDLAGADSLLKEHGGSLRSIIECSRQPQEDR